jgi:hypothetical protein
MKTQYEEDPHFHEFIKQAVTLSSQSLPLEDLKTGFNWLKENVQFYDPKNETFKDYFLKYIDT